MGPESCHKNEVEKHYKPLKQLCYALVCPVV